MNAYQISWSSYKNGIRNGVIVLALSEQRAEEIFRNYKANCTICDIKIEPILEERLIYRMYDAPIN
ncbi:MAG TPA: hypothetical protein DEA89_02655 [Candidatus Moranbacteria bacterium]|nr:MAG: hypothetical protein US09_C0029G0012 [Candidatus Moranbacteria bacterium GW2011_GWD1_36_198]HAS00059.1 hypothetical protein [Candidatus Moranbacteria bacterium]HBU10789.1 hypothetical protein [Candidatus Moranbacteria bacterium]HCO99768.1 hypothetical protein [Candidatus Moranbacteria bacterium]